MVMDLSNIPDLGSRQLLAVLAIADYGSFIAAAAFLKTSQPALTRTIKRIEDVLGVSLFERTTRRVQLTAAGREFVAVAERVLNDLRISVRIDANYADAHYNLAFVCDKLGSAFEARQHWQHYIRLDPTSPWCDYARQRLALPLP